MFRSFFEHHQVLKELKYAIFNRVTIVRNGIPLGFTLFNTVTLKIIKYDVNCLNPQYTNGGPLRTTEGDFL